VHKTISQLGNEKKYFLFSALIILLLFIVSMAQNVIRYGVQENYNPWGTVLYLLCSLIIFIPFLPINFFWLKYSIERFSKNYWICSGLMAIMIVLVFYTVSNTSLYLLGFKYELLSIKYAQQYFGREALYHILLLIGSAFYIHNKYQKDTGKMISGMLGRKEITIQISMINWIEADDHYLKIYTDEYTLIKRSTLEKMAELLKPDFIRIHRKFLINKNAIQNTERFQRDEYIILNTGEKLKVGRTYIPVKL